MKKYIIGAIIILIGISLMIVCCCGEETRIQDCKKINGQYTLFTNMNGELEEVCFDIKGERIEEF